MIDKDPLADLESKERRLPTMIKIYNTLTREKEVFQPLEEKKVKMYVCGPTVYNYIHIGNGRSTVSFDTVRRYFEYRGYTVDYLMNFTDVDDKIIRAAKELGTTAPEVAERFINAFNEDTAALNVKPATMNPRVIGVWSPSPSIRYASQDDRLPKEIPKRSHRLLPLSTKQNPTDLP